MKSNLQNFGFNSVFSVVQGFGLLLHVRAKTRFHVNNNFTLNGSFGILIVAIIMLLGFGSSLNAQIVGFDLTSGTSPNLPATSGIAINYPDMGRVMTFNGLTNSSISGTNGWTCYGWDNVENDAWVTSSFSTVGYVNLTGSCQMKANTNDGPKDFKIQYSLNGTSWTDMSTGSTVTLSNSLTTYNFSLPVVCDNKSTVYVRWVLNSTLQLDGGTLIAGNSSNNASLKGVSIAGNLFAAPSTQASNISIIAVTPTSIKIGCTNGNGNNRIIIINTTNSFTNPVDDYYPTANTTYGGSGEQVIYVGSGSQVIVNVPNATNEFWFRVYEFNKMDDLTRYIISTASYNPKQCKLETIHSPSYTNVRLTRATLGGTITTPASGTITERGIFWSKTSPVDETSNLISQNTTEGGVFTIPNIDVDRGSTIYFKAYVSNLSGTIMTAESSFSNIPVFSGTGDWEDASKWNVQEVPGFYGDVNYGSLEDNPVINGNCTLNVTNYVTNLTVNIGAKLTIASDVLMKSVGTLTNSAGNSGILIKADPTKANGSLVYANGSSQGTVEMYSKAYWNLSNPAGSKYAWQYFGIPVSTYAFSSAFTSAYVRAWDESVTDYYYVWSRRNNGESLQLGPGAALTSGVAYELCQQSTKTYSFAGTLVHSDYNKSLQYTAGAYYRGQNMLSNPYTAAINIADMEFGSNTVQAVYLYNTGTYSDWLNANAETTPGSGPGTYTVSTPATAGIDDVPAQIPSMQGFLVKATANPGSVSYSYANLLKNTDRQRAQKVNNKISTKIDLKGTTFSDRMWIFVDDNCTTGFDNGYDGPKLLGLSEVSQLYGIGDDDIYQINAVNDINSAYIGLMPGLDTSFKLKFSHINIDKKYSALYLVDLVANTTTDITADGSEYAFTSASSDVTKRFKLVGTELSTSTSNVTVDDFTVLNIDNKVIVENKYSEDGVLKIFDVAAKLQQVYIAGANKISTFIPNLKQGVYILKLTSGNHEISKRIIIK